MVLLIGVAAFQGNLRNFCGTSATFLKTRLTFYPSTTSYTGTKYRTTSVSLSFLVKTTHETKIPHFGSF